jgi:hypothetical protein
MPLPNCNNENVAYAFLNKVFNKFGTLAQIFIDQNKNICGEFYELCEKTLIDHNTTS